MDVNDELAKINTIEAYANWDRQSCFENLPTTQQLLSEYRPEESSQRAVLRERQATRRAKNNKKTPIQHAFDRAAKKLKESLRPFPPRELLLDASEEVRRVWQKTYYSIRRQREFIGKKLKSNMEEENRRANDDYDDEAGLEDDDYDNEGQEDEEQEADGQLDANLALAIFNGLAQHQRRQNQLLIQQNLDNQQFLLDLAASPQLRRPHSATRAPTTPNGTSLGNRRRRQAETTPRRVRSRTLFQNSPLTAQAFAPINRPQVSTHGTSRGNPSSGISATNSGIATQQRAPPIVPPAGISATNSGIATQQRAPPIVPPAGNSATNSGIATQQRAPPVVPQNLQRRHVDPPAGNSSTNAGLAGQRRSPSILTQIQLAAQHTQLLPRNSYRIDGLFFSGGRTLEAESPTGEDGEYTLEELEEMDRQSHHQR